MGYSYRKSLLTYGIGTLLFLPGLASASEEHTEEVVVTARHLEEPIFTTPYSVEVIDSQRILEASFRTTPDMFREVPGALVQKTGPGQGSPYIRGFTGYRNLFMIDGIRLNNSVFRDGPNQYWNTVDPGTMQRMEVVRGPHSVLYGSDAIGGTVNVLSRSPTAWRNGTSTSAGMRYRYADGENSHVTRGHVDMVLPGGKGGLLIGAVNKNFGNIESGAGELPNTGYDEWGMDSKLVYEFDDSLTLTLAHSQVHQNNAPRTHRTVASQSYKGTTIGSEYSRNLDQDRELTYARLDWKHLAAFQNTSLTFYHHMQEEERERLRTRDRFDRQGFDVDTFGFSLVTNLPTENFGLITAGVDWAHDDVNSFSSRNPVQGSVADDSTYDWAGAFVQTRYDLADTVDLTASVRLGYFEVDAGKIADPADGTPFSYQQDWTEPVGNVRLGWMPARDRVYLFAGVSQGFRAPNLSDLTRFDTARSNELEVPSVDVDPEEYVSYEIGGRFSAGGLELEGMVYYTDIEDQIQRLATGVVTPDGDELVTKANVGDGELYGFESSLRWRFAEHWEAFGHFAWLDGDISSEAQAGGQSVTDNHSRMMPTNARLGLRYQSYAPRNWWVESEVVLVDDADKLSLRDERDTQRIPPGGTPGYTLWHLRGGMDLSKHFKLNASLENLLDDNYRVHGSGQNEPGRNAILTLTYLY